MGLSNKEAVRAAGIGTGALIACAVAGLVIGTILCLCLWGIGSLWTPTHHIPYWRGMCKGFGLGIGMVAGLILVSSVTGAIDRLKSSVGL